MPDIAGSESNGGYGQDVGGQGFGGGDPGFGSDPSGNAGLAGSMQVSTTDLVAGLGYGVIAADSPRGALGAALLDAAVQGPGTVAASHALNDISKGFEALVNDPANLGIFGGTMSTTDISAPGGDNVAVKLGRRADCELHCRWCLPWRDHRSAWWVSSNGGEASAGGG